jgi:hypothetical protein
LTTDEAKQIADLRLQVSALEVATRNSSLPDMLRQTRRTVWLTALIICAALVASAFIHTWRDGRVQALEDRVKALETRSQ